MKFSSRAHYGLRVMVALAQAYGRGPIALTEIAKVEELSLGYLEQLVARLRRAGLVESTRGIRGGYQLAADPSQLTIGEILRALEGPIALVDCASEVPNPGYCHRENCCPSRLLWQRIRDTVAEVVDSTTLADLCQLPTTADMATSPLGREA